MIYCKFGGGYFFGHPVYVSKTGRQRMQCILLQLKACAVQTTAASAFKGDIVVTFEVLAAVGCLC